MSILQTLEYSAKYGVPLVISAVFIYAAIRFINLQFDKACLAVTHKKHDKLLEMRQEIDEKVYELIDQFLSSHHGTRLQVIEFTNSVTSVAYLPFRFMTCTYEVASYGSRPLAKVIDKLSTSLFTPFLRELSKSGCIVLDQNNVELMSGSVHDLFDNIGSRYQICCILRSDRNKSIGYVSLCKENGSELDKDSKDIQILSSQIAALLGVVDE